MIPLLMKDIVLGMVLSRRNANDSLRYQDGSRFMTKHVVNKIMTISNNEIKFSVSHSNSIESGHPYDTTHLFLPDRRATLSWNFRKEIDDAIIRSYDHGPKFHRKPTTLELERDNLSFEMNHNTYTNLLQEQSEYYVMSRPSSLLYPNIGEVSHLLWLHICDSSSTQKFIFSKAGCPMYVGILPSINSSLPIGVVKLKG